MDPDAIWWPKIQVTGQDEFLAISNQAVYKPDDILYKSIDLAALQSLNPNVTGYIYARAFAMAR